MGHEWWKEEQVGGGGGGGGVCGGSKSAVEGRAVGVCVCGGGGMT